MQLPYILEIYVFNFNYTISQIKFADEKHKQTDEKFISFDNENYKQTENFSSYSIIFWRWYHPTQAFRNYGENGENFGKISRGRIPLTPD